MAVSGSPVTGFDSLVGEVVSRPYNYGRAVKEGSSFGVPVPPVGKYVETVDVKIVDANKLSEYYMGTQQAEEAINKAQVEIAEFIVGKGHIETHIAGGVIIFIRRNSEFVSAESDVQTGE